MCTMPPSPPPPPPPLPPRPPSIETKLLESVLPPSESSLYNFTSTNNNVCKWAQHTKSLWKVCTQYYICPYDVPYKYAYKNFEPILQFGPTCGIVALSMLVGSKVSVNKILDIAKIKGYSNNGEIFSSLNMEKLVNDIFTLAKVENLRSCIKKGDLYSHETVEKLLNGAVLLVPISYDADFNHAPCLKKGHKAHWALVCGVIIVENPRGSYILDPSNVFVICRHGKSKHLAVWRLDKLDESNKNLQEFAPNREDDGLVYVLPEGGIGGDRGLRDQYLLFEWL